MCSVDGAVFSDKPNNHGDTVHARRQNKSSHKALPAGCRLNAFTHVWYAGMASHSAHCFRGGQDMHKTNYTSPATI